MSIEATPVDPRLTFNYSIECDGLEIALCQKVNIPEASVEVVEHSGPGAAYNTKTGGKLTFADITIEKVMRAEIGDKWAWEWLKKVRNPTTGAGQVSSKYKKVLTILHYGPAREILDRWVVKGCWVSKLAYSANDASQKGDKMMESVTLTIDMYDRP